MSVQIKIRGGGIQHILRFDNKSILAGPGNATGPQFRSFDRAERRRGLSTHRQQKRRRMGQ